MGGMSGGSPVGGKEEEAKAPSITTIKPLGGTTVIGKGGVK
jgi:hypothetical protein